MRLLAGTLEKRAEGLGLHHRPRGRDHDRPHGNQVWLAGNGLVGDAFGDETRHAVVAQRERGARRERVGIEDDTVRVSEHEARDDEHDPEHAQDRSEELTPGTHAAPAPLPQALRDVQIHQEP